MKVGTRNQPKPKPKSSSKTIIIVAAVVVLVLILAVALMSGRSGKPEAPSAIEAKLASLPPGTLVASGSQGIYHRPDCERAKQIPLDKLVTFSSVREAEDAMCRPCKQCIGK